MDKDYIHIILADDDEDDRMLFTDAFGELRINTKVNTFNDGVELMDYLNAPDSILPNVLFLDLNMPKKNGIECLYEIKKDARFNDIAIAIFSTSSSEEHIEEYFKNHNALSMIENLPADKKSAVRWYIDCGDDDFLYEGNSLVHIAMKKKEIPHEFRVRDGGHTWTYWRESLPEVLAFVTKGFHQF